MKVYAEANSKKIGEVTELTLLTPIKPGPVEGDSRTYEEKLRFELSSLQRRVDKALNTPISTIPSIHYARWLILRPEQYLHGACFPKAAEPAFDPYREVMDRAPHYDYHFRSWLLFTANFDGELKSYLREFSEFLGDDVDRVWGNCEGYPQGGSRNFEAFWRYAKLYQIPTDAFYAAYPELTVPQIHQLQLFKKNFDAFVRATRDADGRSVSQIAELLDNFILQNQTYSADFPSVGGIYDEYQSSRNRSLKRRT